MATLNTLRTRGGVIVSVVIGLALLAFLLGDLSSAGGTMFNSSKMEVGEISGHTIDVVEYNNLVDRLTSIEQTMTGREVVSTEALDQVRNRAWDQLIEIYAFAPAFKSTGIAVSEAEQVDMVDGQFISPVVEALFTNPSTGVFDPAILRSFVAGLSNDTSGELVMLWEHFKAQMVRQRAMEKCGALLSKGMFVTDMEVNDAVALANQVNTISYVSQEYNSIADSTVEVSDAEVRDFYKKHEAMFRQGATRAVEYVVFDVLPSEQDYADAADFVADLSEEFLASETPMQYATLNSQSQLSSAYLSETQLPAALSAFAFAGKGEKLYGPVLEGTTYTMARVADVRMMPDTLGARHILLPAGSTALADSIEGALKGGASFAELAAKYSLDQQANLQGGDLGHFAPEMMVSAFSDAALSVNKGQYFRANTQFGLHIGQLTYASTPVKKVQLAQITYQVEPSEATQQGIYGQVSAFVSAAGDTKEGFDKAAADSVVSKRGVNLTSSDRNISGLTNAREVVRWAFNAKAGEVSPVMEVDGNYLIAAVEAATEAGIVPVSEISVEIAQMLRFEKKGEILSEKLAGMGSLADAAAALNKEVATATGVEFNSYYLEGMGVEPAVIGAATAATPGALSKPVVGASGVYLLSVDTREMVANATAESEKVRLEAMAQTYINERIAQAITQKAEIVDSRVKFY